MRFTVDSNVLVYSVDSDDPDKQDVAHDIISRGRLLDMILTSQALGEFLNVVRRKNFTTMDEAIRLLEIWSLVFPVAPTHSDHVVAGARLAVRNKLQLWDSIILEVARAERVTTLLTEDMQDGATIEGVRIVNPFNRANDRFLSELLAR